MADWSYIDHFRTLENPEPGDIITLESALNNLLDTLDSNAVHIQAGYSKRWPRYLTDIEDEDDHSKILDELRKHYWVREKQQRKLTSIIQKREKILQKNCEHVWEKDLDCRDHRSHYDCKKCGAYR
jgi:hypothetical protein